MSDYSLFVPCKLWTWNAERKMHHFTRAGLVADVRQAAKLHTLNALRNKEVAPFVSPVHVEFFPSQKPGVLADVANHGPTCKAIQDGIVDAGLLPDDTPEWVLSQRYWPPVKAKVTGINIVIRGA